MRKLAVVLSVFLAQPAATAFAERHSLIVLSQGDHTVYDLNPATGHILKQCSLAGRPHEALFSWDEKTLFVSVPDAGHVAMIDVATFKEKGTIAVDAPLGLAATVDGHKLYVGNAGGLSVYDSKLLVYGPRIGQPGKKINVPANDGQHFKIQPMTQKLYYPRRRDNQVVVIDTKTDAVVKTIPVQGGPVDVAFAPGNEAWVQSEDGSITVIDSSRDEVLKVVQTGGKGAGRIAIAPDIRYIASTHSDTGDTAIIHPIKKEVVGTVKTGRGPSSLAFVPETKGPTSQLYVINSGDSDVAVVDLSNMTLSARHKAGKLLADGLIHYTFPDGWVPPREGTAKKLLETELFTAYENAMFNGDVSPVHEHRRDFFSLMTGIGVAKIGCWSPECPPEAIPKGALPYVNSESSVGSFTGAGLPRGTIHQEEGVSPSPRRGIFFELKLNYYRQTQTPRPQPVFAKAGLRKLGEGPLAVGWDVTLEPGKPLAFPEGAVVVVYLGGGLLRVIREGKPEIVNRYYNDLDWDPTAHTIEALSNPVRIAIIEFK